MKCDNSALTSEPCGQEATHTIQSKDEHSPEWNLCAICALKQISESERMNNVMRSDMPRQNYETGS